MGRDVRLETRDGYTVCVEFALLRRSRVIQCMCRWSRISAERQLKLPVHGIGHEALLKILLWLQYHMGDEEPAWVQCKEEPPDIERFIDDWDKEFLRDKLSTIRVIMLGADYLDLPWLVKLCARKLRQRALPELYLSSLREISPID